MSDPFRLRVLKNMTAALQGVTPANGYSHDLSTSVFRGRDEYDDNDPLPMVSILEHPDALDTTQATDATQAAGGWRLLVQGFVKDDPKNPTDPAYHLVADVIAALVKEKTKERGRNIFDLGFGENCVEDINIGSPVCRPADGQNSSTSFFWLTVTLSLIEDLENPFA